MMMVGDKESEVTLSSPSYVSRVMLVVQHAAHAALKHEHQLASSRRQGGCNTTILNARRGTENAEAQATPLYNEPVGKVCVQPAHRLVHTMIAAICS
jgi:hypothetical protein